MKEAIIQYIKRLFHVHYYEVIEMHHHKRSFFGEEVSLSATVIQRCSICGRIKTDNIKLK